MERKKHETEESFEVVANENIWFVTDKDEKVIASKVGNQLEFFNIVVAEIDFEELKDVTTIKTANGRTRKNYSVIDFDYICCECNKDVTPENVADAIIGFFEDLTINY